VARILFTTLPMAGHVRPSLPIAGALVDEGHEVLWYTGRKYADAVVAAGARFLASSWASRRWASAASTRRRSGRGSRRPPARSAGRATGC
jgi:hypothetical protein